MVKPPVVFVVGALRALGLTVTDSTAADYLDSMGQIALLPAERVGLGGRAVVAQHEHRAGALRLRRRRCAPNAKIDDVPGRDRAARRTTAPTPPSGTAVAGAGHPDRAAQTTPARVGSSDAERLASSASVVLRTLMLAGPDAQVM